MRNIRIVKRQIEEVKEMLRYNTNTKAQAKKLRMELITLEKERQSINWR